MSFNDNNSMKDHDWTNVFEGSCFKFNSGQRYNLINLFAPVTNYNWTVCGVASVCVFCR